MGRKKLLASDCTLTQLMQPFMVRDTAREYVHIIAYKVQTNAILLRNFHHLNWMEKLRRQIYIFSCSRVQTCSRVGLVEPRKDLPGHPLRQQKQKTKKKIQTCKVQNFRNSLNLS